MYNNNQSQMQAAYTIRFAAEEMFLLAGGAIFWPTQKALMVADLHLEKGSYFAQYGHLLPHYDTRDTLQRLEQLIAIYQPKKIFCLGDNFHNATAIERMAPADYHYLCDLNQQLEWIWVIGNHDKGLSCNLLNLFHFQDRLTMNNVILTHEFIPQEQPQIIGHFHPKMSFTIRQQLIKGKCFIVGEKLLIMPAFGSYTGGLDIYAPVYKEILGDQKIQYFLLKNNKIWKINAKLHE